MKKSVMRKWVKALRSGKYAQCRGILNHGNRYCCLGVLCEVLEVPKSDDVYGYTTYDGLTGCLSKRVQALAGLSTPSGEIKFKKGVVTLVNLNDARLRSFKSIAAFIERNYKKL